MTWTRYISFLCLNFLIFKVNVVHYLPLGITLKMNELKYRNIKNSTHLNTNHIFSNIYIYTHIHIYMCVCVCVLFQHIFNSIKILSGQYSWENNRIKWLNMSKWGVRWKDIPDGRIWISGVESDENRKKKSSSDKHHSNIVLGMYHQ